MLKKCQIIENIKIPFFPKLRHETQQDNVSVWWFEQNFCQSKYGENSKTGTNSCTLIVIITANRIAKDRLETTTNKHERLPDDVVSAYAISILKANKIYADLVENQEILNPNFNIPEGMETLSQYCSNSLQEWFFVQVKIPPDSNYVSVASYKLYSAIRDGLKMWTLLDFQKDFLFVIIIADMRSILLCFELKNQTATVFDSHCHTNVSSGAVVAQTNWKNLDNLSNWIVNLYASIYNVNPKIYELSFLPLKT